MKIHLMAATAAFALFAGSAAAQTMTSEQMDGVRTQALEASAAGGEVTPSLSNETWRQGQIVPQETQSSPVDGMDGFSFFSDGANAYVMDDNSREIVGMVALQDASGAGGETTPGPDGNPVSQPTTAN